MPLPATASEVVDQRTGPLPPVLPPPVLDASRFVQEGGNPKAAAAALTKAATKTAPAAATDVLTSKQGSVVPYTFIEGPEAWHSKDVKLEDYVHTLTPAEVQEVDAALEHLEKSGLVTHDGKLVKLARQLTPEDFPLPTLGPLLTAMGKEVHWGRGFALLRGIPVERYTRLQSELTYWGFGLYWGNPVRQNKKGHLLGHVKDLGFDSEYKDKATRIYMTRAAQPWHMDAADLVGLLCLKPAKSGGLSRWASSVTIYNTILKEHPELVPVMAGTWYWDRKNEVPAGKAPYFILPIVNFHGGYLSLTFDESYIRLAPNRNPEVPPLTPQQEEVIRLVNEVAGRPEVQLTWSLQPGDLQLLNNHTVFHTRDTWEDFEEPAERRHLLRLWLAPADGRPLPEYYAEVWNSVTPGARGGIVVEGGQDVIPLEAEKGN